MSKIGFNLGTYGKDEFQTDLDDIEPGGTAEGLINEFIAGILNPPEWQVAYEQTLFWAVLFNTHHKVNQC
jgi:hypothetical protein